ncbi:MAG: glycerophosphodiester phosphodiesterase [Rhodocyclaceae bacterium]|nr:glycerophosphodiester phosphodiesterase [Rhodocyclaceae bacterium]
MTRPWRLPRLLAHRGGGTMAPENTLAGLRAAAEHGFRAVEFDVMLSADGVPVLIHDETLERTTNGAGRVSDTPFDNLRRLDAGSWLDARFAGEPVPAFDKALDACRVLGLAANVEIKPAQGYESETGREVARVALGHGGELDLVLSSFSLTALREAQKLAPDLPRGVLFRDLPVDWLGIVRRANAVSVHCEWSSLRETALEAARAAGVPIVVYTCNDPLEARRLLDAGVSGLITDRLDLPAAISAGDV